MKNDKPFSDAYVKSCWRVFKPLLLDAYAQGHMPEDITQRHDTPRTGIHGRQEKKTLSRDRLDELIEAFATYYPDRVPKVITLAHTGMRPGELYGLEWGDVDLEGRMAHIRRGVYNGVVDTTKTKSPRRAPLTDRVVDALREHRKRQMTMEAHAHSGIVFPSTTGGRRHSSSICKSMGIVAKHLDPEQKVTPQVLRRTMITLLVEAGVDRIVIWSIVGHSSEEMTQRYTGVRIDQQKDAFGKVFELGITKDEILEEVVG